VPRCIRLQCHIRRGVVAVAVVVTTVVLCMSTTGCGQTGGKLLYVLGFGRGHKVPAEHKLPEGTVLVLVDDPQGLLGTVRIGSILAEKTGEALLKQEATDAVVSQQAISRLRRTDPEFERRPADGIGRRLGARTVIWLQVKEFFAPNEVQDTESAAVLSVAVKLLDARAKKRALVRLWPTDPDGRVETVQLRATHVAGMSGQKAIARKLAERLARQIARLFYTHTLGELEDDRA